MKTYNSFGDWYKDQSASQKKIISKLKRIVNAVEPSLVESSKWTNGVWLRDDRPIIYIHTEPDHVQLGFFAGSTLSDPTNILRGKGKHVRHIRIEGLQDVDEAALTTMVRKAVKGQRGAT